MSSFKILFMMSGSIAAVKAGLAVSRLVQEGHDVQVVATRSALNFIGKSALEGFSGKKVLIDLWEDDHAMDHIRLTRWADMAVLCPASAHTLARLAHGFADDLVGALSLAWPAEKAFHIFPAMNHSMLNALATQTNLQTLAHRGFTVHATRSGKLACREAGEGRLPEPDEIVECLRRPKRGRVLITAGATREPIDGIRFLTNVSTGQTGASLADALWDGGWQVTLLHGLGACSPHRPVERLSFSSFSHLDELLRRELQEKSYSAIIHCAAVSDYSVASVNERPPSEIAKLSSADDLQIRLRRNHKILPRLKEYSCHKNIVVVGFKLTLNESENRRRDLARQILGQDVDAIVVNDWAKVTADRRQHPGEIVFANGHIEPFQTDKDLATRLQQMLLISGEAHDSLS